MPAIIIPRRHYTQPQGRVEIAPEYGSSCIALPSAFDPYRFAGVGGLHPIQAGPHGLMFAGEKVSLYDTDAVPGYPFFYVSRFLSRDVTSDRALGSIAGLLDASNRIQISFLNGKARFIRVGSAIVATEATITANSWHTVVCVGRSPTDVSLIINGEVKAVSTAAVTFPRAWQRVSVGNYASQTYPAGVLGRTANADQALAAWVYAYISNDEARSLSINPWQIFRADPVRIYSLPSGPIIPSISAVTMSNILQTSATTNIQLVF